MVQELRHLWEGQGKTLQSDPIKSVFFGGGTPSLMPPSLVRRLLDTLKELCPGLCLESLEVTLEANPNSMEIEKLRDFRDAGINRLSMGIQSLNQEALGFLGRRHTAAEALAAMERARSLFTRFSFDLIYALPNQMPKEWQDELTQALSYGPTHLSLYQLTIEEGTAFYHAHKRGDFSLPNDDLAATFYELTQAMTRDAGLPAYEVSNHSKEGQASQHNMTYWRYGSYGAIGPGGHARLMARHKDGVRVQALKRLRAPETWLTAVETHGHGTDSLEDLTQDQAFEEALMMGLRLHEGVQKETLMRHHPHGLGVLLKSTALADLKRQGFITESPQALTATSKGMLCLNQVTGFLLTRMGE